MVQYSLDMGQSSSLPKGRRKSLRSSVRKASNPNNHLSHTFTIPDNDDRIEQLNINIASEEELMTLPGVNREIARSIVEHRKAIGRFRKVEDLALVRGIGADKLQVLRPEICVSTRKNHSCASSRAPSYDSLRSTDSRLTVRSNKLVNINKATVFELQAVHGITQEIAAAIVLYRNKKGPFKQVEDLHKVKNIDRMRLDNISRFLTVENYDDASESEEATRSSSILTNGYTMPFQNGSCSTVPLKLPVANGLTSSSAFDIFELLSAYSPRPIAQEDFKYCRNGEPAVRVASWNVHEFSYQKANNLGVREVICRTILENGWSILAVQDVTNVTALRTVCEELNKPRLRRVKEWRDRNHSWNFCMLDVHDSKLGFIYDSDGVVDIDLISLNEGPEETRRDCEVLVATFRVGELNLQMVNLMLNKRADVQALNRKISELVCEGDNMLIVFVDLSVVSEPDEFLYVGNLKPVFSPSTNTNFVYPKLPTSIHHTSNMLCNSGLQGQLTGMKGIVRQGLTHLAIPNGWSWGGPASPFCPVWAELFLSSNVGTAL
ncbi:hypothetical protein NQ315_016299 [Exocentrus adspersus]|uniref:Endonuclease/exonuclease/phosphatase family domain-containing protein 1 n=1 Tax=Exocentrus adspersus TaxID=1586481 RepID=A0AAV8VQM4_9CUCU|nr:hypothetical protein NQ315_016299 [Exocentrus adspersus]